MNIYQSSSKTTFLREVYNFIIKELDKDLLQLKVILPNGSLCNQLKDLLIKERKYSILPEIISITELSYTSESAFKLPLPLLQNEEKIILTNVISSYRKFNYSFLQGLKIASGLSDLLFHLEINEIDISDIKNLVQLEEPQHWYVVYDFLEYAFKKLKEDTDKMGCITKGIYQKLVFESQYHYFLNNPDQKLLIAGLLPESKISRDFIKNLISQKNINMILPPASHFTLSNLDNNPLYKQNQLFESINYQPTRVKFLNKHKSSILDQLITSSKSKEFNNNIKYIEFENIFHEAEYIAEQSINSDKKIAIITTSQDAKERYCNALDKYNIAYEDLFGVNILKEQPVSLLLITGKIIINFNNKNLFAFLSHPLVNCTHAIAIKNIIRHKGKFASDWSSITTIIDKYADIKIKEFYTRIREILDIKISNNTQKTIKIIVKSTEKIFPRIWKEYPYLVENFRELIESSKDISIDILEILELIRFLLDKNIKIPSQDENKITICKPNQSILIDYDLIIFSDLNDGIYPPKNIYNSWLSNNMLKNLNLAHNESLLYEFYLIINTSNVILTRSRKRESNQINLPSPLLLRLFRILNDNIKKIDAISKNQERQIPVIDHIVSCSDFPKKISATEIDMLIKSPYNFYVKKILKISKINDINDEDNFLEFGNVVHKIIDIYTKKITTKTNQKLFESIAEQEISTSQIPLYIKRIWSIKLAILSDKFIKFDNNIRENCKEIYSEITGSIELNILGKKITISARVDRIELQDDGSAKIIDYKTGSIPTISEIKSGNYPQLLVGAIILSRRGFQIDTNQVYSISYIKIRSSSPYIEVMDIKLTKDEITKHEEGLVKLLEYYVREGKFDIQKNQLRYDDYKHLARRS